MKDTLKLRLHDFHGSFGKDEMYQLILQEFCGMRVIL